MFVVIIGTKIEFGRSRTQCPPSPYPSYSNEVRGGDKRRVVQCTKLNYWLGYYYAMCVCVCGLGTMRAIAITRCACTMLQCIDIFRFHNMAR